MGKFKVICFTATIFLVTVLVVFSWTGFYTPSQVQNQPPSIQNVDPNPSSFLIAMQLFFAHENYNLVIAEERRIPNNNSIEEYLIRELIAGPKSPRLKATIPKETVLISLEVVEEIAFVNFSKDIQHKHWGGSAGEVHTIASIVLTLTQLPNIEKVQIFVEGERIETLLGHVNIFNPLKASDINMR